MPELPGPPDELPDGERKAWFHGAATVAQLQADQWAIIAREYREAAADVSHDAPGGVAGVDDDAPEPSSAGGDDEDGDEDGACPECGGRLVASFGGDRCLDCGYTGEAGEAADDETSETSDTTDDTSSR